MVFLRGGAFSYGRGTPVGGSGGAGLLTQQRTFSRACLVLSGVFRPTALVRFWNFKKTETNRFCSLCSQVEQTATEQPLSTVFPVSACT